MRVACKHNGAMALADCPEFRKLLAMCARAGHSVLEGVKVENPQLSVETRGQTYVITLCRRKKMTNYAFRRGKQGLILSGLSHRQVMPPACQPLSDRPADLSIMWRLPALPARQVRLVTASRPPMNGSRQRQTCLLSRVSASARRNRPMKLPREVMVLLSVRL